MLVVMTKKFNQWSRLLSNI